jgi:hypothetical protein
MSHDSTYTSTSIAHVCSDRPADSTRIVSYIRRQNARTVPNVDIVGSSKCHTRHLATGGVARFNYVLVTNSNPVTTCASDGRVNPYPNTIIYSTLLAPFCTLSVPELPSQYPVLGVLPVATVESLFRSSNNSGTSTCTSTTTMPGMTIAIDIQAIKVHHNHCELCQQFTIQHAPCLSKDELFLLKVLLLL